MIAEVESWGHGLIAEMIRPPRRMRMGEWCEENLILSRRQGTPFPGAYRMRPHSPWAEGLYDALQDPDIHTVALMKGAQVSATQTALGYMCYCIVEDPDPILFVQPTQDMIRSTSRLRFRPLMEDSPMVRETFTGERDDIQNLEYKTKQAYVRLVGANSPVSLASFAHRHLVVDEADKIKEQLGREGSTLGLVFSRTKQFWNRKRFLLSTPTTKAGFIYREFMKGDQRKFFVPCPHCKRMQFLRWKQVKFNSKKPLEDVAPTAYYECEKCKKKTTDSHKAEMVQKGKWRATVKASRSGYASFHMPGLYSLSDECSFGALAEKWVAVQGNMADLQQFINEDLGEIFKKEPKKSLAKQRIYEIRDRNEYRRGFIPTKKPCFVFGVADVQVAHIVWTVWAAAPHDLWLIDHGYASVLEDAAVSFAGPFVDEAGKERSCIREVYDSGHRTTEVYKHVLSDRRKRIALKGGAKITKMSAPIKIAKIGQFPDGKPMPHGMALKLVHIHPSYFKDELSTAIDPVKFDDESEADVMLRQTVRIHFHKDIDEDFVHQITGEVLVESDKEDKFGDKDMYWKKVHVNDFFDTAQYAFAFRYMARNDLRKLEIRESRKDKDPAEARKNVEEMTGRKSGKKEKKPREGVSYDGGDDDMDNEW